MLEEVAGEETVQYIKFSGTKSPFTGTVNNTTAYTDDPKDIPALIDYSPSEHTRKMIGLDVNFDATLMISLKALTEKEITLKIGDAFVLPDGSSHRYVEKIIPTHQAGSDFLVRLIAVGRRSGRR
jgi:hypothetical protein